MCESSHSGGFTISRYGTSSAASIEVGVDRERAVRARRASALASASASYNSLMASSAKPLVRIVTPGHPRGEQRELAHRGALGRDASRPLPGDSTDRVGRRAGRRAGRAARAPQRRLHPRASASAAPSGPSALVLTGTDLYRDLPAKRRGRRARSTSPIASWCCRTMRLALLPRAGARKAERDLPVGAPAATARRSRGDRLDCVVVGHLREEKDPRTLFRALRRAAPIACRFACGTSARRSIRSSARPRARSRAARSALSLDSGPLPHGLTRAAIAARPRARASLASSRAAPT